MSRRALSATRAADVLNFLAAHPGEAFSYSQLSQRLQVNLASIHNLLIALVERGYLTRSPSNLTFSLGPALVALGDAALRANPAVEEARVHMRRLSRELGRETLAFVRASSDVLCIARAGPAQAPGRSMQVGQRIPLMAPLSSAFVAWGPDDEIERWLLRGGTPRRDRRRQLAILSRVRERGFSVALEVSARRQIGELLGELAERPHSDALRRELRDVVRELARGSYQLGVGTSATREISTLTAPVFDPSGRVGLVLTVQVFERGLSAREIDALGQRLLRATRAIAAVTRRNTENASWCRRRRRASGP